MKKYIKKIFIILFITIILCGCSNNLKATSNVSENLNLEEIIKENNYIIVDVRTKEEYSAGHVKNALNIPYDTINENTSLDKSKTIMVYCKSGGRSKIAYDTLKKLGYNVYDLGSYDSINLEKE